MNNQIQIISTWLGAGSVDIFGSPFSGKDTQGKILADMFNGEMISGGDLLRSHEDPENIKQIMAEGGIIPSEYYLGLVLPYLSRPELKNKPLFLSAVGRSHGEEPIIMKAATESGHPIKAVVSLKMTESVVWQRFEKDKLFQDRGNRSDDSNEALKTRMEKFQNQTLPVIDYYRDRGLLVEVDGALTRDEVTNEILKKLVNFISK